MEKLEKSLKAVANRRRLAILKYLKENDEAPVYEISKAIKLSVKATSKHLRILSGADILEYEQRGLLMFYHLSGGIKSPVKQIIYVL